MLLSDVVFATFEMQPPLLIRHAPRLAPVESLIQRSLCSQLWSLVFCRDNQQAGHFDKHRASPQSKSPDMKVTAAVRESVVSFDLDSAEPGDCGRNKLRLERHGSGGESKADRDVRCDPLISW